MDMGEIFLVSKKDSVAVLDTGATANLVCFRWLANHNRILQEYGIQRAPTYPSKARSRLCDRRLGEVRHAADIPVRISGNKVAFTAFALEMNIPALLRRGTMEALGGQWDFLSGSTVSD